VRLSKDNLDRIVRTAKQALVAMALLTLPVWASDLGQGKVPDWDASLMPALGAALTVIVSAIQNIKEGRHPAE